MSFLEEFRELQLASPRIALQMSDSENSDYTNYAFKNENCYLVFGSHYNEDCYHLQYCYANKDCVDCDYLFNCFSCSDCEYSFDLINCQNCFLYAGMRNTSYHIKNKPVPKEKYNEEVAHLISDNPAEKLLEELEKVRVTTPQTAVIQKNCENCTGSFLKNCKNASSCFFGTDLEDCLYMQTIAHHIKDSADCDSIGYDPSELLYECIGITGGTNNDFCYACWHNSDIEYCELVFNSKNCFGCVARNHAKFEILNKKYSKEDYFKKVKEIKEELKKKGVYCQWL